MSARPFEFRIPLLNARTAVPQEYIGNFSTRSATALDNNRWRDNPFVRDVVPHRILPQIDTILVHSSPHNHVVGDAVEAFEEDLLCWFGLSSLHSGRLVEASFGEQWHLSARNSGIEGSASGIMLNPVRYLFFALPPSESPPWNGPIALDNSVEFVDKGLRWFYERTELSNTCRFVLARWLYSLNKHRRTLEDAILDLSIALESIFILDSERNDRARLLRERVARYWIGPSGSGSALRTIRKALWHSYNVRSRVVHGTIVSAEALKEAHDTLDQVLRELLLDFVNGNLEGFDPTAMWSPDRS
jgi:hypothetical protein